jgi:hypothetical protein
MTTPLPTDRESASDRWLLLIHQLPPKPAYFRVKIWRRLQMLGAVALKSSVYALPLNEETQEDFEWLLREIEEGGGEGSLCAARFIDGLSDAQVVALFNAAREADYEKLAKEARGLAEMPSDATSASQENASELRSKCTRLQRRLAEIERIDFFGANGREGVAGLLAGIEERLAALLAAADPEMAEMPVPQSSKDDLKGKVWVTRRGVYVDRIACAWLIRRFIDPDARFKFVAHKGYKPQPGELRFDMFEAEFTHKGDWCSFEVLLDRIGLTDPALKAIAEIVHDIDLKDGKFARPETAGIARLITGVAVPGNTDEERIARGSAIFEDLYASFREGRA